MKRYTKREVSWLLGAVPPAHSDHAYAPLCRDLARVVRQMRREKLAEAERLVADLHAMLRVKDAAIDRLKRETWRPIATAPKDGTAILAWCEPYGIRHLYWASLSYAPSRGFWQVVSGSAVYVPTQWMPIPPAPEPK